MKRRATGQNWLHAWSRDMRHWVIIITASLLFGCASPTVSEFRSPAGVVAKQVKCNVDSQKCMLLAAQSCPAPGTYQVVSSESHAGGTVADVFAGPVTWYAMQYICGPSDGRMPEFAFRGQQYAPIPVRVPQTTNCNMVNNTMSCTTR